ncbi:hypothetical protein [Bacterioplanoides sp.]|uniref:hypothetical protein n=1 Tax=Bacterioplanoides sp. TaxID=2066072 RepID=UPI003B002C1E
MPTPSPYDMISDYLNGHLNAEDQAWFEAQLQQDKALNTLLLQEQKMRRDVPSTEPLVQPDFAKFEQQLDKRERSIWLKPALPALTACFLLVVFLYPNSLPHKESAAEYITLSQPQQHEADTVRLIAANQAALEQLIGEYQLQVINDYPGTPAVDVSATPNALTLLDQVQADPRIIQVKHLPHQQQANP